MKKEKIIKTHTRKTKSGKTVTVRQHTAKYDAAEAAKEALKKAGAGKEFEKKKANKIDNSSEISPEDFKAWYHWDAAGDPKNKTALAVEKKLKKKLGAKGYREFFDKATDSYSARGHNKAFKEVCSEKGSKEDTKTSKVDAKTAKAEKSKASSEKTPSTSTSKKPKSKTPNKEPKVLEEFSVKDSIKAAERLKKSLKKDADFVRNGDIYIGSDFGGKAKPQMFEKHIRKLDKAIELLNKGKYAQAGNILREYQSFNSKKDMNKDSSYSSMSEELLKREQRRKNSKSVSKGKGKEVVKGSKNIERVSAKSLEKVSKGNSKKPVQESKKPQKKFSKGIPYDVLDSAPDSSVAGKKVDSKVKVKDPFTLKLKKR